MKKLIFLIVFLSLSFTLFAQNRKILTPDGKLHSNNEVIRVNRVNNGNHQIKEFTSPNNISSEIDTLEYPGPWNVNFGFFGQDRMIQWFVAPTDMILRSAGVSCFENQQNAQVGLKIVKLAWDYEQLDYIDYPLWLGYYEAAGNGYNDITAYLDDPDRTGSWVDVTGEGLTSPFGDDVWSDGGLGYQFEPVPNQNGENYNWVPLDNIMNIEIAGGEIIGVSVKNLYPVMNESRIGWWASSSQVTLGLPPAYKFYANGRLETGVDFGWWSREFTWDFVLEVSLLGDTPPEFIDYTISTTTLYTEPITVEAEVIDRNPSGGPSGVAYVGFIYSTDGGSNWTEIWMSGSEPYFSADLPGFSPGTQITYKYLAMDVQGNTSTTLTHSSFIFGPQNPNLIVFNGLTLTDGFPQDYYFGADLAPGGNSTFAKDVWAYGPLTEEVVEFYNNIYEFCLDGPVDFNQTVIRNWLETPGRNYFLAGQDWLCAFPSYTCPDFGQGDFEYDILGLDYIYSDVSYTGTSGQELPSLLISQENTLFGEPIKSVFDASGADSLQYNPNLELNFYNWIDAFDVIPGQQVDLMVETRGIMGQPFIDTLACATHRILPNGNKVTFLSYDPLALNTAANKNDSNYVWVGFMNENTPYQTLSWFDIPVGVEMEEKEIIPGKFRLYQNYPNPFNPTTKIKYSISSNVKREMSNVNLKVYDVLGNEIATLVNEEKPAGSYEVEWDASSLPSGVYFYQLRAGEYIETKKMIVMK